jgi:hypothetical protein
MTAKSLANLSTDIDTQLPTNNVGQIHADTLRALLRDIINNEYVPISNILTSVGTPGDTTYLRGDGSWQTPATGGGGGTNSSFRYLAGAATIASGDLCYCDTSSGGFVLTLPTSPVTGQGMSIRDAKGTWSTNNVTLDPGSNPIANVLGVFPCNVSDANFDLVWRGPTIGWDPQFVVSNYARGLLNTGAGTSAGHGAATGTGTTVGAPTLVTLSPTNKSPTITLSGGNLNAGASAGTSNNVMATGTAVSLPGYFEMIITSGTDAGLGVTNTRWPITSTSQYLGQGGVDSFGFFASAYAEGPGWAGNVSGGAFNNTNVMGIKYDGIYIYYYKDGTLLGHFAVPTSAPGGGFAPGIFPAFFIGSGGGSITVNFGATPLAHLPSGAHSWDGNQ